MYIFMFISFNLFVLHMHAIYSQLTVTLHSPQVLTY